MTDEVTKTFFDTFGIEPKLDDCNWQCQKPSKLIYMCENNNDCEYCKEYPQITDRILLELICVLNKSRLVSAVNLRDFNYEDLKNTILRKNITILKNEFLTDEIKNEFKQQVRTLFKEVKQ